MVLTMISELLIGWGVCFQGNVLKQNLAMTLLLSTLSNEKDKISYSRPFHRQRKLYGNKESDEVIR